MKYITWIIVTLVVAALAYGLSVALTLEPVETQAQSEVIDLTRIK